MHINHDIYHIVHEFYTNDFGNYLIDLSNFPI